MITKRDMSYHNPQEYFGKTRTSNDEDLGSDIPGTWMEAFSKVSYIEKSKEDLLLRWIRMLGGELGFESFLFDYILPRDTDDASPLDLNKPPSFKFTLVMHFYVFEKDFHPIFSLPIKAAAYLSNEYDLSPDDIAILVLLGLRFPSKIYGLATWLRAENDPDIVAIASLLRQGVKAEAVGEILSHDLDSSILSSFLEGKNTPDAKH